jgi:predicted nucleic acid-binding protein
MIYLLDANILIGIMEADEEVIGKFQEAISKRAKIFIDAISYYQTKRRYLSDKNWRQLEELEDLCKRYDVLLHDNLEIFNKAAENWAKLKKKDRKLKKGKHDADILIASNAMYLDYTVVSTDEHFDFCEQMLGLKRENWKN